jgi:hypothetical protein
MRSKRYIDKYGQVWIKVGEYTVKRSSDGCIGGWFNGVGLKPL